MYKRPGDLIIAIGDTNLQNGTKGFFTMTETVWIGYLVNLLFLKHYLFSCHLMSIMGDGNLQQSNIY